MVDDAQGDGCIRYSLVEDRDGPDQCWKCGATARAFTWR
jgi:hypothetical protein